MPLQLPNKPVLMLSLAQALMLSVNTLLLTSSAIIGFSLAENKEFSTLPLALQLFSTMLSSIPASMIMQKYGRKAGFILSSLVGLCGAGLCLMALQLQSFPLFCFGTVMFGIYTGFGNYFRFVATEVSDYDHKNSAISYVLAGGIIAAVIGPNIAFWSKDIFELTYAGSFIAVFILYSLNLVNFILMDLPKPESVQFSHKIRPLREIAQQPVFVVAVLSALLGYSIMALLMTATPLALTHENHNFSDVAFIIQWHVLGMFVPSFFTGHLINRFGAPNIILFGAFFMLACVLSNLLGTSINHFWFALLSLGIGWNFMFIGGTSLLTQCYKPEEAAKTQAINDFFIFSFAAFSSLSAGILQYHLGWAMVNISVVPLIFISITAVFWLKYSLKPR